MLFQIDVTLSILKLNNSHVGKKNVFSMSKTVTKINVIIF